LTLLSKIFYFFFFFSVAQQVAKIRRQIGESWKFKGLFKGLSVNLYRNVPLLSSFFVFVEISKRFDIEPSWRPFVTGSVCATMAWTLVWPFDVLKSQEQGSLEKKSISERASRLWREHGLKGFFRGYGPGAVRSLIANGLSMVVYVKVKTQLEQLLANRL
jgi:hypothetical protein